MKKEEIQINQYYSAHCFNGLVFIMEIMEQGAMVRAENHEYFYITFDELY